MLAYIRERGKIRRRRQRKKNGRSVQGDSRVSGSDRQEIREKEGERGRERERER